MAFAAKAEPIRLTTGYLKTEAKNLAEMFEKDMAKAYAEGDVRGGIAYELCLSSLKRHYGVMYPADWDRIKIVYGS